MSVATPQGPALSGLDFIPVLDGQAQGHVTRFAPSPTGYLHLGHVYAAMFAFEAARQTGGRFLLRLEDIDQQRCRPEFAEAIMMDLRWAGLHWDGGVVRQSERPALYLAALKKLEFIGVIYPCFCSRKQIRHEVEEAGRAPHGPAGELIYPGICRHLDAQERAYRMQRGEPFAWRLDVEKAAALTGPLQWYDIRAGWMDATPETLGDVVLGRKDAVTGYHLAVTVDDAAQGVTLVSRGEDLFHATHVHRLLQALLGLPVPRWYHHNLVADRNGMRMAKRNGATTLRHLRSLGHTPADLARLIGVTPVGAARAAKQSACASG